MVKFKEFINEEEKSVVPSVYVHINNGGVEFKVIDGRYGPKVVIKATHFDNQTNGIELNLNKEAFIELADMFKSASEFNFLNKENNYSSISSDDIFRYDGKRNIK